LAALKERRTAILQPTEVRRIVLRIGINLGDVGDGADIYGDGVNIAAQLEALAEPGGVCISAKVHDEVRGKIDVAFEDTCEQTLKNMVRPVQAFCTRRRHQQPTERPLPTHDKPSIAVLPFANMSGDAEQQYFCDGIFVTSPQGIR
jgi:adenylate cyclase